MMTRRDFIILARALNAARPVKQNGATHLEYVRWVEAVIAVADALKADNPRFDREVFYTATGVED